jgi:molecular chaperone DnaK
MAKILGIDLGTTYSEMAIFENGQAKIIENNEGERTTPSMVALSKNNERLVGVLARRQSITNPTNTIFSAKRFIGVKYDDDAVQKDIKTLSFETRKGSKGEVEIQMGEK